MKCDECGREIYQVLHEGQRNMTSQFLSIYLQVSQGEGNITWCQDKIHDDDVKYLNRDEVVKKILALVQKGKKTVNSEEVIGLAYGLDGTITTLKDDYGALYPQKRK